jgi:hypothetical protein
MKFKERHAKQLGKKRNYSQLLTHASYGFALAFNTSIALSLPYSSTPSNFIAKIQFNEYFFDGSLNGIPVQGLTTLSVSLAMFVKLFVSLVIFHPSTAVG